MSELSDERKRQIREEERARAAELEAEQAYREQVRRELAGDTPTVVGPAVPDPAAEGVTPQASAAASELGAAAKPPPGGTSWFVAGVILLLAGGGAIASSLLGLFDGGPRPDASYEATGSGPLVAVSDGAYPPSELHYELPEIADTRPATRRYGPLARTEDVLDYAQPGTTSVLSIDMRQLGRSEGLREARREALTQWLPGGAATRQWVLRYTGFDLEGESQRLTRLSGREHRVTIVQGDFDRRRMADFCHRVFADEAQRADVFGKGAGKLEGVISAVRDDLIFFGRRGDVERALRAGWGGKDRVAPELAKRRDAVRESSGGHGVVLFDAESRREAATTHPALGQLRWQTLSIDVTSGLAATWSLTYATPSAAAQSARIFAQRFESEPALLRGASVDTEGTRLDYRIRVPEQQARRLLGFVLRGD